MLSGGVLDPTFGTGGVVTTNVASVQGSSSPAVATYPNAGTANDGKIVAAGRVYSFHGNFDQDLAVVRYNLDGSLDQSFGNGGQVTTNLGSSTDGASDVKVQPDGKVVVAGWTGGNSSDFALVRYNADGSLDTSFGGTRAKGKVLTDINKSNDFGRTMALQPDGKIVVAGTSNGDLALVRYNADGSLDSSFGTGGKVTRHFTAPLAANYHGGIDLAIDPSTSPLNPNAGKLVVVAQLNQGPLVVARLSTNGSPDVAFGSNGAGYVSIDTWQSITGAGLTVGAVAIQSDDRIVVAGIASGDGRDIGLARFNPDGTLDATFGSGGMVDSPLPNGEIARSLALQPDGKIVVAGDTEGVSPDGDAGLFLVARYNASDGSLDASFGTGGVAVVVGDDVNDFDKVDVALEPDGRIVLAGIQNFAPHQFALVRFLAAGPQTGLFTASPNPVPAGSSVTLTASDIAGANPGGPAFQVAFYVDSNGNGVLHWATDALLGYASYNAATGTWALTISTAGWAPGTYTIFARAEDRYGAFGDPLTCTIQVI